MNPKNRTPLIIGAVVVLVLVLAGVAVLLTGGDDDGRADSPPVPTFGPDVEQSRPVTFTGDPLPTLVDEVNDAAVGLSAPVVVGETFDGRPVTIGEGTGSPTLLVFLAHWCPHCNAEVPEIIDASLDGHLPDGLDVVGISTSAEPKAPNYPPSEWVVKKGWLWPVLTDDANSTAIGVYGGPAFPYMVLLDGDGTVVARRTGEAGAEALGDWVSERLAAAAA